MEYGLEGVHYYDPPNLTYPYGSYVVVVEVDPETGVWKVQRMVALDDCGVRINPMIVEGQIHGGLTEGFAKSSMQWITFDEDGNCIGSNFMDYLIPTAWETPSFELLETCVPSPHHPIGAKGVGESATVGSPAAYVNAVIDALAHLGVRNIDMPLLPDRVWSAIQSARAPYGLMDAGVLAEAVRLTRRAPRLRARDRRVAAARRAPATSGSKGIVLDDGTVHGFIGGACAEPAVVREALDSLGDGRPRLVFLGSARRARPTTTSTGPSRVPMACESEGALEVYIEPFLPAPQLVVIGRSPAVHALTVQARTLDWDVAVIDDGGRASEHPYPELVRTTLDLVGLGIGRSTAIVVATQGHYDDLALRAALATDAGYIGVVAAREAGVVDRRDAARGRRQRRAARTRARAGRTRSRRGRQRGDRGRGARRPRRPPRRGPAAGHARAATPRREAIDPVCGMTVFVDDAKYHTVHDGTDYWFCASICLRAFQRDPASFVG